MPAWGIGFGLERLGVAALKFPRLAMLLMLGLLALISLSLPRLSFDDDIHRVFLSDSPLSQAQRDYQASQTPPSSTVLIHITAQNALTAVDMTALRDLSLDLEFSTGVIAVASPFVLRLPPTANAPSGTPLFGPDITPDFARDLSAFQALGTGLPSFITPDLKSLILSVSVDTSQTSLAGATTAIKAELTRALPPRLTAALTGEDVISLEIVSGLKADLLRLNLIGALIVTLAAFALLRDLRMALLAVVPALAGAAGVLALSVWLGYPVTVLSNVIPILLLVLGVADGVHLARYFKDSDAVRATLVAVGPACALTALTTALAFASILLTGNAQLFEFAVLGTVGTLFSFAIGIVLFTLIARFTTLSRTPIPQFSTTLSRSLVAAGTKAPRVTIALCVLLLGITAFGFSQTKAWFPLYQNLPDNSPTLQVNDAIARDFGGVFQMIVETDGDWAHTRATAEQLEQISGPRTVLSELNLARWLGDPNTRPTDAALKPLPQTLISQLRPADGSARIFVAMPEPMRSPDSLQKFDRLYDSAMASGARTVFGLPTIMRQEAVTLIRQLSLGLVLAALGATLLVALAFRSLALVPILLIPNILPLMLTGASLLFWAQGQLSPTAVLALTIAFGIAIDDTVHFLSRFNAVRAQGLPLRQAITTATKSAGEVMVLTTLLLTAGLCVTLLSDFTPIRLFGGMMIITLWSALLLDLILLPALLVWKRIPDETA